MAPSSDPFLNHIFSIPNLILSPADQTEVLVSLSNIL